MRRQRADGAAVELVTVDTGVIDKPLFTKDLLPVGYVTCSATWPASSIRRCTACSRSAAPGAARRCPAAARSRALDPPAAATLARYAIKWDGEWQITYETFRDMGAAYAVGLVLIYLLVVAQFRLYLCR